jgi:hypothetical protein
MVETERHTRLRPYEIQLKKFNYQQVCVRTAAMCLLLKRADITALCACCCCFCKDGIVIGCFLLLPLNNGRLIPSSSNTIVQSIVVHSLR